MEDQGCTSSQSVPEDASNASALTRNMTVWVDCVNRLLQPRFRFVAKRAPVVAAVNTSAAKEEVR